MSDQIRSHTGSRTLHSGASGCRQWMKAQQSGTDNEMYGRLLRFVDGEALIGCGLEPIDYCPWCGHHLSDEQEVGK